MRRSLLLLPLALAVAGCAHPQTGFPPADKLVCPDEPDVPAAPVTDEANGKYLTALRGAYVGCKSDVEWLNAFYKELRKGK